jgi:hypothetical protein
MGLDADDLAGRKAGGGDEALDGLGGIVGGVGEQSDVLAVPEN